MTRARRSPLVPLIALLATLACQAPAQAPDAPPIEPRSGGISLPPRTSPNTGEAAADLSARFDTWESSGRAKPTSPGSSISPPSHTPSVASPSLASTAYATRIPGFVVEDEESLKAVFDRLRTLSGLPIVVDQAAEEAVLDEGVVFDLDFQNPIRVRPLLDLLVELGGGTFDWTIRHGAILVTTPEKARSGHLSLRFYDVRDLVAGIASFPGPRVGTLLNDGDDEDREIVRSSMISEDALVDLITSTIEPDTWDDDGVSIELRDGLLVVRHTARVHSALGARFQI